MKHNSIGNKLRAARLAAQLTQSSLSKLSGLRPSRLCHLERGRRFPTREEWTQLAKSIQIGPYPVRDRLPAPRDRWYAQPPLLTPPERPFSVRLSSARSSFSQVDELVKAIDAREDARACHEFLNSAALESGDEAIFYLKLLAEGCRPCACSPLGSGYRSFPVIDAGTRLIIGDLRLPCLEILQGDQDFLIFPQLCVLAAGRAYRLDGLVCARCPVQKIWLDLEIDGPGHNFEFDLQRTHHLRLPTLRLAREDLLGANLLTRLSDSVKEFRRKRRLASVG